MSFGLYLHFPFCRNKCSYCDFYKELYDHELERQYYKALQIETELVARQLDSSDKEISTIYIGGGTPSLTSLELFENWLNNLRSLFDIRSDVEFSFENNPESVTVDLLSWLEGLGVNRPAFGIQSFNVQLLRLLDRKHRPDDSHRAVYLANALGFGSFGVDFLYGLPNQTGKLLSVDLDELIDLNPPHVSFYHLTVEEGTPLYGRVKSDRLRMPDDDLTTALYRGGAALLTDAGYERYEICSFAKPGHECRHNLAYWEGGDYLGLGPAAHSFMDGRRFANSRDISKYVDSLLNGKRPLIVDESGLEQRMTEAIMLGLRTTRGINRSRFASRFGRQLEDRLERTQYDMLVESGHLIPDRGSLRLSDEGLLLADEITRRLVK